MHADDAHKLAEQHFATLVAVDGDEVLGMIGLFAHDSYEHNDLSGRVLALIVAEHFRRRGIARDLIASAEHYFLDRNIRRVVITTRLDRADAHRFYEAMGYTRTGVRFGKQLRLPSEEGRQPTLAHVHGIKFLATAALGRQTQGEAGVKERNREITRVAGLMARAWVGGKCSRAALGAI